MTPNRLFVLVEVLNHVFPKIAVKADSLEQVAQLVQFVFAVVADVFPFEVDFSLEDLILRFGGHVLAGSHADCAGNRPRYSGEEDVAGRHAATHDAGHQQEHRDQAVVDTQDDVAPVLAMLAEVFGKGRSLPVFVIDFHAGECTSGVGQIPKSVGGNVRRSSGEVRVDREQSPSIARPGPFDRRHISLGGPIPGVAVENTLSSCIGQ